MKKSGKQSNQSNSAHAKVAGRETRVDPAHPASDGRDLAPSLDLRAAVAGMVGGGAAVPLAVVLDDLPQELAALPVVQQVRRQAQQLAAHLRRQHEDVERRESQILARIAQQENSDRTLRLWMREGSETFGEREAAVARREAELERRLRMLDPEGLLAVEDLDQPATQSKAWDELQRQQAALRDQADALRRQRAELNLAAAELVISQIDEQPITSSNFTACDGQSIEAAEALLQAVTQFLSGELLTSEIKRTRTKSKKDAKRNGKKQDEASSSSPDDRFVEMHDTLVEALRRIAIREQTLRQQELLLTHAQSQLATETERVAKSREAHVKQVEARRRELDECETRSEEELAKQQKLLEERSAKLDRRADALEQMRDQLLSLQRETLENRLALEELQSREQPAPTPAQRHTLAQIRNDLAEVYRQQQRDLAAREERIAALATHVAEQHRNWSDRSEQLERWTKANEVQLQQQVGQLASRERELAEAGAQLDAQRRLWQNERAEFISEHTRLLEEVQRLLDEDRA